MWPFRKKSKPCGYDIDAEMAGLMQAQRADMQRRLDEQINRMAAMPLPPVVWTPLINAYGQIVALAWKNDRETALRLLEQPAEGRA